MLYHTRMRNNKCKFYLRGKTWLINHSNKALDTVFGSKCATTMKVFHHTSTTLPNKNA